MKLLIKNGQLLDPATKRNGRYDVLVEDGIVTKVQTQITDRVDTIMDVSGCYVMPGLIDLHVHLREPGYTHKETIATGARAAVKGGFTTICAMPNTKPVTDNGFIVSDIVRQSAREALCNVLPIGAMTVGQQGLQLADLEGMAREGAIAFSEDGKSVMNADLCRKVMEKAASLGLPIFDHCEDKNMAGNGVMNAGSKAKSIGVAGITNAVEDVIIAREIFLAKETGCQLHICHCTTKDSVLLIWMAKEQNLPVTGEVCPHHFILTDEDIPGDDAAYKMNPPLRSREDVEALIEGLRSGIMDVIATDHAPHSAEEKAKSMAEAPFGIVGLETAVALTYTELVKTGILTPMQMVEKMSYNPARILGINRGTLAEGSVADITVIDPKAEYTIDKNTFVSKGKNTPFHGRPVTAKVRATIVNGKVVYFSK